jgi:glycosyltransferase involved in cell wall biosynthesis
MNISIIIHSHNSEECLDDLLQRFTHQEVDEVVVVDNGSTDHSIAVARQYGANVCRTRDQKLGNVWNAGIPLVHNAILWFLDAHSRTALDAATDILDEMESEEFIGGYFNTRNKKEGILDSATNKFNTFIHRNEIPENGLFLLRTVINHIGGFPDTDRPVRKIETKILTYGPLVRIPKTILSV